MNIITDRNNVILITDPDNEIRGGKLIVNGKTYDSIKVFSYSGEIPEDLIPEKYVITSEGIKVNPDFEGNDLETRLNDIEQILIDLLDTM